MAGISGPNINSNGLVFYYDAENTDKSWRGEPTTNQFLDSENFSTASWTTTGISVSGQKLQEIGAGAHWILQDTSVTSGLIYTQSVTVRAGERQFIQITGSTGFSNTDFVTFDLVGGVYQVSGSAVGQVQALEDGWYRCSATLTANATTSGRMAVGIVRTLGAARLESYTAVSGYGLYIRNAQIEQTDHPTPFVNGSRTNTDALLDITGNTILTINELTYNIDGTFEFDGINDTIDGAHNNSINLSTEISEFAWIYVMGDPTDNRGAILTKGGSYYFQHYIDDRITVYSYPSGGGTSTYFYSTSTITRNQWVFVGWTEKIGYRKIYINGAVDNEAQFEDGILTDTQPLRIGAEGAARKFNGRIQQATLYNRALSDSEVYNNFQALRTRFGI